MKRLLLIALAVLSAGLFDQVNAAPDVPLTPAPAPQTAAILASGEASVNQVYYVRRRRRRVLAGYRTVTYTKWRYGRRYVVVRRVPVYVWRY